ncbi:MAG TPA: YceI family protein [Actinomycetota bacterium]|nr:YceI family protein [Actinomycetota bacterium]
MSMITAARTMDGVEIPAAGTWDIDPTHTTVEFIARHLLVSKVRGRFGSFSGSVIVADQPYQSSVSVSIDPASLDTGNADRDGHLRSSDFFDVDTYGEMTFVSTGFTPTGKTTFDLPGTLTIRGIAKPVVLQGEFIGLATDPWGGTRAAFSAATEVDREDWGLTWNKVVESGGVLVSKTVRIELEVQLIRKDT